MRKTGKFVTFIELNENKERLLDIIENCPTFNTKDIPHFDWLRGEHLEIVQHSKQVMKMRALAGESVMWKILIEAQTDTVVARELTHQEFERKHPKTFERFYEDGIRGVARHIYEFKFWNNRQRNRAKEVLAHLVDRLAEDVPLCVTKHGGYLIIALDSFKIRPALGDLEEETQEYDWYFRKWRWWYGYWRVMEIITKSYKRYE